LLREARQELCATADDLFYAADLLHKAGDHAGAADIAALAERVLTKAENTTLVLQPS
jgi:hypothetical protein